MIKLKNLITEYQDDIDPSKVRRKVITADETFALVDSNCKTFMANRDKIIPIYRGVSTLGITEPYNFVQPSKYTRTSANTTNEYTMLIDILPSWNNFPKRSKSIVCSTSEKSAYGYGEVYVVIPFDGANIAVCSRSDFWVSFPYMNKKLNISGEDLTGINGLIRQIFRKTGLYSFGIDDEEEYTKEEFLSLLKKVDFEKIKRENPYFGEWYSEKVELLMQYPDIITALNDILDPVKNGFTKYKYEDFVNFKPTADYGHEVWTDSDCILIGLEEFDERFV